MSSVIMRLRCHIAVCKYSCFLKLGIADDRQKKTCNVSLHLGASNVTINILAPCGASKYTNRQQEYFHFFSETENYDIMD